MTIPVPRALAALQDAIRAEVRDELIAELTAWRASLNLDNAEGYLDGIDDAITTLGG